MKIQIQQITLDFRRGNTVDIRLPGIARPLKLTMAVSQQSPVLVQREREAPYMIPVLWIAFDPDAPLRTHRFIAMSLGGILDTNAVGIPYLDYVDTVINPNSGMPLVLYQVPDGFVGLMDAFRAEAEKIADAGKSPS